MVGAVIGKRGNGEISATNRIGIERQILTNLRDGMSLLHIDVIADGFELIREIKVALSCDTDSLVVCGNVDVIKGGMGEKRVLLKKAEKLLHRLN